VKLGKALLSKTSLEVLQAGQVDAVVQAAAYGHQGAA